MIGRKLDEKISRKNFYRDGLRRATIVLLLSMIIVLILTGMVVYTYFTSPSSYYYTTSNDGRVVQLMPVSRGTALVDPEGS